MRKRIEIYEQNTSDIQKIRQFGISDFSSVGRVENTPLSKTLTAEGCENFINYIDWLGLPGEGNPVILSSMYHYYFDVEEMKNVNTVISLKEFNQIKHIRNFLHSIYHSLPHKAYFVGCFVDNSKINGYKLRKKSSGNNGLKRNDDIENGIFSRNPFLNMLFSLMDLRTNKYMSKRIVSTLLGNHGFKVLDMTELNGLTYFCAQRLRTTDN
jgi:hypothetical protein